MFIFRNIQRCDAGNSFGKTKTKWLLFLLFIEFKGMLVNVDKQWSHTIQKNVLIFNHDGHRIYFFENKHDV